jgi:hypothetical protein
VWLLGQKPALNQIEGTLVHELLYIRMLENNLRAGLEKLLRIVGICHTGDVLSWVRRKG